MDQPGHYVDNPRPVSFEVERVDEAGAELNQHGSYYQVSYEYFNGLSTNVTIVDRHGIRVAIPPNMNAQQNDLVIRMTITIGREVIFNIDDLSNSSSKYLNAIAEVLRKGHGSIHRNQKKWSMDFQITQEDMASNGGSLYLTNLDVIVSINGANYVPFHPFSERGIRNNMVQGDPEINRVNSFGYSIQIHDSTGYFGERYVNVNGTVYRIPVITDSPFPDGVYLNSSGPSDGGYRYPKPISERYDFSVADEKLRLYKRAEEARLLGDELAQRERELEEEKVALKERTQHVQRENAERREAFEEQKLERERERGELEHERKMRDIEIDRQLKEMKDAFARMEHQRNEETAIRKDEMERRSLERKNTSEVIKFLPTVVSGVLAVALVVQKFKPG